MIYQADAAMHARTKHQKPGPSCSKGGEQHPFGNSVNFDGKRSSGCLQSREGLLLATDVSTTCAEAITNNRPSQDPNHPDDPFQSRYVTPGFKPLSYQLILTALIRWLGIYPYPA